MFFAPHLGWRRVSASEHRTRIDWAHQIQPLLEKDFPRARKVHPICDNLNTHHLGSLYQAFPAEQARRLAQRLNLVYTPRNGSWLNVAEIELSVLSRQCLNRRIGDERTLHRQLRAWNVTRNWQASTVTWQFTTADARIKLRHLYHNFSVDEVVALDFSMKAALCSSRWFDAPGRPKVAHRSSTVGTDGTASRSSRRLPSRPSVGVWGCTLPLPSTIFGPPTSRPSWLRCSSICRRDLSWSWTAGKSIAPPPDSSWSGLGVACTSNGCRRMLRNSIRTNRSGRRPSTGTWRTFFRRMSPILDRRCASRSAGPGASNPCCDRSSIMPTLRYELLHLSNQRSIGTMYVSTKEAGLTQKVRPTDSSVLLFRFAHVVTARVEVVVKGRPVAYGLP